MQALVPAQHIWHCGLGGLLCDKVLVRGSVGERRVRTFVVEEELVAGEPWSDVLDEAMATLDGYGPAGRNAYLVASLTLDTLFPLAYVTFLAGVIYRWRRTDRWGWLALAPVVAGLVDLGEDLQVVGLLLSYPALGAA